MPDRLLGSLLGLLATLALAAALAVADPAGGERPTLAAPTVADVAVTARPDQGSVTAGDTVTWTVDITNRGPDPLPAAGDNSGFWGSIGGAVPSRWEIVGSAGPPAATSRAGDLTAVLWTGAGSPWSGDLTAAFSGLPAGETVTYTATFRVSGPAGPAAAAWRVLGSGEGGAPWFDPDPSNNETAATVAVR